MGDEPKPEPKRDMGERHELPLEPEEALKALLKVDPKSEPGKREPWACSDSPPRERTAV